MRKLIILAIATAYIAGFIITALIAYLVFFG